MTADNYSVTFWVGGRSAALPVCATREKIDVGLLVVGATASAIPLEALAAGTQIVLHDGFQPIAAWTLWTEHAKTLESGGEYRMTPPREHHWQSEDSDYEATLTLIPCLGRERASVRITHRLVDSAPLEDECDEWEHGWRLLPTGMGGLVWQRPDSKSLVPY